MRKDSLFLCLCLCLSRFTLFMILKEKALGMGFKCPSLDYRALVSVGELGLSASFTTGDQLREAIHTDTHTLVHTECNLPSRHHLVNNHCLSQVPNVYLVKSQ